MTMYFDFDDFDKCYYRRDDGWCVYANEHCAYVDSLNCAFDDLD